MRYLIHLSPEREWYVNEFLIPSMRSQGIRDELIFKWCDTDKKGNLISCMDSFKSCTGIEGGTWHLQDDVIISRDFSKRTLGYNDELVCGICINGIGPYEDRTGYTTPTYMWHSFQCIYIPNYIAASCARWFYSEAIHEERFKQRISGGKSDDYIFRRFVVENYRDSVDVVNLKPNLVDHIDFLIGGTLINKSRTKEMRAKYFKDQDLIEKLRGEIDERNKNLSRSD